MKKIILLLAISFAITSTHAQFWKKKDAAQTDSTKKEENNEGEKKKKGGFMGKVMGKIAKVAGNTVAGASGTVAVFDDWKDVSVVASVGTNIYSKDLGILVTDFFGKDWISNGDFTMLGLSSKDGFKMYKYGGNIKVNNKELKHFSMGIHSATENPNTGKKKITFEKNGTVEGSFEIPVPEKNIKLISINGQNKNVKVDLTKDVQLELANFSTNSDALIRVDLVLTTIGIRSLYCVGYVKPGAKITVPAANFRNIETDNKYNFKDCYLAVSDQTEIPAQNLTGVFKQPFAVYTGSNDGMWIDVTASNNNNKGIEINGNIVKKNAAYCMPLSKAKNIAVSSFYTYATTYAKGEKDNKWTNTKTTKTIDFPEVPDAVLDNLLDEMYKKFTATLTEVLGSTVLPASTIPNTTSYESFSQLFAEETNNEDHYLKIYKGLSPIQSLGSFSYMSKGVNYLLKDAKADALLKVKLIGALGWPDGDNNPSMTSYLTIELVGASNGDFRSFAGPTHYFTFDLKGEKYFLKNKTVPDMNKIYQIDKFNEEFKKMLTELIKKEKEVGDYEIVWNAQK